MRVFIAEDQLLLRQGLTRLLHHFSVEIAGVAEDAVDLVQHIIDSEATIALLDIRMPPGFQDEGVQVARELRELRPNFPVVLLSQYIESTYLDELLASGHGACGYFLKDSVFNAADFVASLRQVASGHTVVDPEAVARLNQRCPQTGPLAALSDREYEVLGLVARGVANSDIAQQLFVTPKAVAKHLNSIFSKLGLDQETPSAKRVKAVLLYLKQ